MVEDGLNQRHQCIEHSNVSLLGIHYFLKSLNYNYVIILGNEPNVKSFSKGFRFWSLQKRKWMSDISCQLSIVFDISCYDNTIQAIKVISLNTRFNYILRECYTKSVFSSQISHPRLKLYHTTSNHILWLVFPISISLMQVCCLQGRY